MSLNEQQRGPPEVLKEPNTVQNCWKQRWTWVSHPCGCTSYGHFTHFKVFNVFIGNSLGHCNPWILTYAFLLQAAEPESGWIWSSFNPTFSVRKTHERDPLFAPPNSKWCLTTPRPHLVCTCEQRPKFCLTQKAACLAFRMERMVWCMRFRKCQT